MANPKIMRKVFSEIKSYNVGSLHEFPSSHEIVPKQYKKKSNLFFREPSTHASLVYNVDSGKVKLLKKKSYWESLRK